MIATAYTISQYRRDVRRSAYAWPGGYPLYAVTTDGAALCYECFRTERRAILNALGHKIDDGWRIAGIDANYEDPLLYCDHCNARIESAYAED